MRLWCVRLLNIEEILGHGIDTLNITLSKMSVSIFKKKNLKDSICHLHSDVRRSYYLLTQEGCVTLNYITILIYCDPIWSTFFLAAVLAHSGLQGQRI